MGLKFHWDTYEHLGYPHTKFHPIPRGSCAKLWLTVLELPSSALSNIKVYQLMFKGKNSQQAMYVATFT